MRETVEIQVFAHVPVSFCQSVAMRQSSVDTRSHCLGTYCYPLPPVAKCRYADVVRPFTGEPRGQSARRGLVPYGDVTSVFSVYVRHHSTEQRAVSRCVPEIVRRNITVYHFVDYDILPFRLRQIKLGAQPNLQVNIASSSENLTLTPPAQLADKRRGPREDDRYLVKRTIETQGIEAAELLLGVLDGHFHIVKLQLLKE